MPRGRSVPPALVQCPHPSLPLPVGAGECVQYRSETLGGWVDATITSVHPAPAGWPEPGATLVDLSIASRSPVDGATTNVLRRNADPARLRTRERPVATNLEVPSTPRKLGLPQGFTTGSRVQYFSRSRQCLVGGSVVRSNCDGTVTVHFDAKWGLADFDMEASRLQPQWPVTPAGRRKGKDGCLETIPQTPAPRRRKDKAGAVASADFTGLEPQRNRLRVSGHPQLDVNGIYEALQQVNDGKIVYAKLLWAMSGSQPVRCTSSLVLNRLSDGTSSLVLNRLSDGMLVNAGCLLFFNQRTNMWFIGRTIEVERYADYVARTLNPREDDEEPPVGSIDWKCVTLDGERLVCKLNISYDRDHNPPDDALEPEPEALAGREFGDDDVGDDDDLSRMRSDAAVYNAVPPSRPPHSSALPPKFQVRTFETRPHQELQGAARVSGQQEIQPCPMERRKYDFFINHCQHSGQDQCANLAKLFRAQGWSVWYDMSADDLTEHAMQLGVSQSRNMLIFLSDGLMSRPFCLKEQRWGIEYKCKFIGIMEQDSRHGPADLAREREAAPEDLKFIFDQVEFEPYQRRKHLEAAMVQRIGQLGRCVAAQQVHAASRGASAADQYMIYVEPNHQGPRSVLAIMPGKHIYKLLESPAEVHLREESQQRIREAQNLYDHAQRFYKQRDLVKSVLHTLKAIHELPESWHVSSSLASTVQRIEVQMLSHLEVLAKSAPDVMRLVHPKLTASPARGPLGRKMLRIIGEEPPDFDRKWVADPNASNAFRCGETVLVQRSTGKLNYARIVSDATGTHPIDWEQPELHRWLVEKKFDKCVVDAFGHNTFEQMLRFVSQPSRQEAEVKLRSVNIPITMLAVIETAITDMLVPRHEFASTWAILAWDRADNHALNALRGQNCADSLIDLSIHAKHAIWDTAWVELDTHYRDRLGQIWLTPEQWDAERQIFLPTPNTINLPKDIPHRMMAWTGSEDEVLEVFQSTATVISDRPRMFSRPSPSPTHHPL